MVNLIIFILIVIVSTVPLMFFRDKNQGRKILLNILLGINAIIFAFPMILAILNTPDGISIWNENFGGAFLFLYFFILPVCLIVHIILLVIKLHASSNLGDKNLTEF